MDTSSRMNSFEEPVQLARDLGLGSADDDAIYQAARDAVASLFGMPPNKCQSDLQSPDYRSLSRLETKRVRQNSEAWTKSLRRLPSGSQASRPDTLLLASNGAPYGVTNGASNGVQASRRRPSSPPSPSDESNPSPGLGGDLTTHHGGSSGSLTGSSLRLDDLRESELQLRRKKAFIERVIEQHEHLSEQKRHNDILQLCERLQETELLAATSTAKPHHHKSSRIKTNGSLPRDRCAADFSPTFPAKAASSSSDDVRLVGGGCSRSSNGRLQDNGCCGDSPPLSAPGSPRRGIRTVLSPKETFSFPQEITSEVIESRLDLPETLRPAQSGHHTPKAAKHNGKDPKGKARTGPLVTSTPRERGGPRFIFPLEEGAARAPPMATASPGASSPRRSPSSPRRGSASSPCSDDKVMALSLELEFVQKERLKIMSAMTVLKAHLADIEAQREEAERDASMEQAFIRAELQSKADKARAQKARIAALQERADKCQREVDSWQENRHRQQRVFCMSLQHAEEVLERLRLERDRAADEDARAELRDRLLQQADVVESEKKLYEDLEFKYLEEESVWLARREELSKELAEAIKKHDEYEAQVAQLESWASAPAPAELNGSLEHYAEQRQAYQQRLEEGQAQLDVLDGRVGELVGQGAGHLGSTASQSDGALTGASSLGDLDSESSEAFTSMESSFCSYYRNNVISEAAEGEGRQSGGAAGGGDNAADKGCAATAAPSSTANDQSAMDMAGRGAGALPPGPLRPGQPSAVTLGAALGAAPPLGPADVLEQGGRGGREGGVRPPTGRAQPAGQHLAPLSANGLQLRRGQQLQQVPSQRRQQRPLTRYLPIRAADLDLRQHIESAGHAVELCGHVAVDAHSCRGVLHKASARFGNWQKRWFVFDRSSRTLAYYKNKRDQRVRGGVHFQAIAEVYVDHTHTHKHATPNCVFVVKTTQRSYQLMAPSPEAMRIWVDVIFTGAEAYQEFD